MEDRSYYVVFATPFASAHSVLGSEDVARKTFDRLCRKEDTLYAAYGEFGEDVTNQFCRDAKQF